MPLIKSAKKAVARSLVLKSRNLVFKNAMKLAIKNLRKAVVAGTPSVELQAMYVGTVSAIDRAQRRNVMHANNASRKKSRLAKLVATVK
jgi:small subunit ribosomal protein S20